MSTQTNTLLDGLPLWLRQKRTLAILASVAALLIIATLYRLKPPPKATYVTPSKKDVIEVVLATGKLQARQQAILSAEIQGVVSKLLVDEGDRVKQGQKLLYISSSDTYYRTVQARVRVATAHKRLSQVKRGPSVADVSRAKADLSLARSKYQEARRLLKRTKLLYKKESTSRAELDKAQSLVEQSSASERSARARLKRLIEPPRKEDIAVAKAQIEEARAALRTILGQARKRWVRAPFSGVIVRKQTTVGRLVNPGTPLLHIASFKGAEVYAETDENNLPKLKPGQKSTVIATAYKNKPFSAKLTRISPMIDSQRGVVGLRFKPEKLPSFMRLEMTVDVNIEVAHWKGAINIPVETLFRRGGAEYVVLAKNGYAVRKRVDVVGKNADRAVIKGISMEDKILLRGYQYSPGQAIRARPQRKKKRR